MTNDPKKFFIDVDRGKRDKGVRIRLAMAYPDGSETGYRLHGSKYLGQPHERLVRHPITKRDIADIRAWLNQAEAALASHGGQHD